VEEVEMVVHILNSLLSEYDTMIETLEGELDIGNLTLGS
jgi:hypothetical protein